MFFKISRIRFECLRLPFSLSLEYLMDAFQFFVEVIQNLRSSFSMLSEYFKNFCNFGLFLLLSGILHNLVKDISIFRANNTFFLNFLLLKALCSSHVFTLPLKFHIRFSVFHKKVSKFAESLHFFVKMFQNIIQSLQFL